jgi:hypothetical protein
VLIDGVHGRRRAYLRELSGRDELIAEGTSARAATELLDAVLVDVPGTSVRRGQAATLCLSDRDRLIAHLHIHCFGERIESSVRCTHCGACTEIGFSLQDLLSSLFDRKQALPEVTGPDDEGAYTFGDGRRFRLPTTVDEAAVAGLSVESASLELARRCISVAGGEATGVSDQEDAIQKVMEMIGPVVDLPLAAACAECGSEVAVQFDIVRFFLAALEKERPLLVREVHRLAAAYHWGLNEIMNMPRRQRRAHVQLAEAERIGRRTA